MTTLRTIVSALSIVVGVLLIVGWALAHMVVSLVEDGTAARALTERALDSPALMNAVADDLTDRTVMALSDQGVNVAALGLEGPLNQVITRAIDSHVVRETLLEQADDAHRQFTTQLTDSEREAAPLTLTVDVSDAVNARLGDLGAVANLLPQLDVPSADITVLEADRFEQTREAYDVVRYLDAWGLWLGVGALILGIAVSYRRRWFVAKALVVLGVLSLAIGGVLALLGPAPLARLLPGGESGQWAGLWGSVVGEEASSMFAERALILGAVAIVGALIATAIAVAVGGRRRT